MNERSRFSITVSLFAVTLGVAMALAAAIITYTHYANKSVALEAGHELMDRSAEVVRLRTAGLIAPVDSIAQYSRDWLDVTAVPKASGHPSRKRLISFVKVMPQIANIFIGYEDGSNYLIGAARTRSKEHLADMGAPDDTHFLEQVILRGNRDRSIQIRRFLDVNGDTLATKTDYDVAYDPRERPWYREAQKGRQLARTDVYLFAGTGKPGFTVSKQHASGVVGVDIALEDLEFFLSSEPQSDHGLLAIISSDGTLVAQSLTDAEREAGHKFAAIRELQTQVTARDGRGTSTLNVDGRMWITHLSEIELGAGQKETLVIALPLQDVIGEITDASRHMIIVSVLIALCSIPLVWLISRSMSRPLKTLAEETQKIRNFELDRPFASASIVDEIFKLEVALEQMRKSIKAFGRYVPKALVRQMIERRQEPEIGGDRREITVLFLDLENFTAMSSGLEPEEVMRRMSQYFEIVTDTLLKHEATIDKYIGDSVMAFWNAPNAVEDHPVKACQAALAVLENSRALTGSWTAGEGLLVRTRIGIHTGLAIVGNVGSSDRLNYTALGDTVNLASRLEGLNRDLKTEILISESLSACVQHTIATRSAGQTRIKGYPDPVTVYEVTGAV